MCLGLYSLNDELCEYVSFTVAGGRNYYFLWSCKMAASGDKICCQVLKNCQIPSCCKSSRPGVKYAHCEAVLGFSLS